jgi:hypothetical protein
MVKTRRSLPFVLCTVPAVGIFAITILAAGLIVAR